MEVQISSLCVKSVLDFYSMVMLPDPVPHSGKQHLPAYILNVGDSASALGTLNGKWPLLCQHEKEREC